MCFFANTQKKGTEPSSCAIHATIRKVTQKRQVHVSILIGPITLKAYAKTVTLKTSITSVRPSRLAKKWIKQKRETKYRIERKLSQVLINEHLVKKIAKSGLL